MTPSPVPASRENPATSSRRTYPTSRTRPGYHGDLPAPKFVLPIGADAGRTFRRLLHVQEEDPLRSELRSLLGDRLQLGEDEAHLLQHPLLGGAPTHGAPPQGLV